MWPSDKYNIRLKLKHLGKEIPERLWDTKKHVNKQHQNERY